MKQDVVYAELQKINRNKQFLVILSLLFVCAIAWTIITLFNSQQKTVISKELEESAISLNPVIDETVLADLETERSFTDEELAEFTIYRFLTVEKSGSGGDRILLPLGEEVSESGAAGGTTSSRVTPSPTPAFVSPSPSPAPAAPTPPGSSIPPANE